MDTADLGLEKWQVYLLVLALSQLIGAMGDLVGSRCTRVIYGGSATQMLIGSSLVGATIVVIALVALDVAQAGQQLVRIGMLATNPVLIVQNGLLATAYHVAEVELYKSPWGSVMKPIASLFSPLLVIPLSWVLLPPSSSLGKTPFASWPLAAVLGVIGSLLVSGNFKKKEVKSPDLPDGDLTGRSGAMIPVAFGVITCCYALWNLLQRVSSDVYAVNEYEWIVLDKVVGTMWIMGFFVLIDHSPAMQRRLHGAKAESYVPFTASFNQAMRNTFSQSGLMWVIIFSMMQYARMGLTYVFLASDDVQIAVASFMVSITRVFASGAMLVCVNAFLPSFLNLTREERAGTLSRRPLIARGVGLLLTLCSICVWLSAVSVQDHGSVSVALSGTGAPAASAFEVLMIGDWGCKPGSVKSCKSQGPQRSVAAAMSAQYLRSANRGRGESFSFILNLGDSFYDGGLKDAADVASSVANHEDVYGLPGLQVPWKTVLGNHDYRGDLSLVVGKHIGVLDTPATYYDWYQAVGGGENIHFIALDTNFIQSAVLCKKAAEDSQEDLEACRAAWRADWKEQMDWLEAVLRHDSSKYKVVYGHHPCYGSGKWAFHENDENGVTLAGQLDPIFDRYGVNAYISGHDHVLQVMRRRNTHYFIVGSGGANVDSDPLATVADLQPSGVAFLHSNSNTHQFGFGHLSATSEEVCIDVVAVRADDASDRECARACFGAAESPGAVQPC